MMSLVGVSLLAGRPRMGWLGRYRKGWAGFLHADGARPLAFPGTAVVNCVHTQMHRAKGTLMTSTGTEFLQRVQFVKVGDVVQWLPLGAERARTVRVVSVEQYILCVELLSGGYIGPVSPTSLWA